MNQYGLDATSSCLSRKIDCKMLLLAVLFGKMLVSSVVVLATNIFPNNFN